MISRIAKEMLIGIALAATFSGCSESVAEPELFPLSGTISHEDKPPKPGGLLFKPEPWVRSGLILTAEVLADGTFTAQTVRTDPETGRTTSRAGLPVGRYKVIYQPVTNGAKMGTEIELDVLVTVAAKENAITLILPLELPEPKGQPRDDDNSETEPVSDPNAK